MSTRKHRKYRTSYSTAFSVSTKDVDVDWNTLQMSSECASPLMLAVLRSSTQLNQLVP